MSMSSPNMNMYPYMGVESGTQAVPELSRLIGSAMLIDDCIDICIWCASSESAIIRGIAIPFASCMWRVLHWALGDVGRWSVREGGLSVSSLLS